jgi:hypothetical protein
VRALTIRQPWAGLIIGSFRKTHGLLRRAEVRKWPTKYRGPLLIHAGVNVDREACRFYGITPAADQLGVILGQVRLVDVIRVTHLAQWEELQVLHLEPGPLPYGDATFVWRLSGQQPWREPLPAKGRLGLWKPESRILSQVPA